MHSYSAPLDAIEVETRQHGTSILFDAIDVDARLQQLGLSKAMLMDALSLGVQGRVNCSHLHPATYPGQAQWADTVLGLRLQVCPANWTAESHQNLPVTIAPDESFGIVVYTGDKDTGRRNGYPSNKTSKGLKTQQAVLRNNLTQEMFPETLPIPKAPPKDVLQTWVLLYHLDASDQQHPVLRAELSFPSLFDKELGKIVDWEERIILDEIDLSDDPSSISINPFDDEPPEVSLDIPVRRKTA